MMKAKGRAPIIIAICTALNGFFAAPELPAISSAPIEAITAIESTIFPSTPYLMPQIMA
jgi:hypothetical protein